MSIEEDEEEENKEKTFEIICRQKSISRLSEFQLFYMKKKKRKKKQRRSVEIWNLLLSSLKTFLEYSTCCYYSVNSASHRTDPMWTPVV